MQFAQILMDSYDRRARLEPAFVILIPAGVTALLVYPEVESLAASALALFVYFGGLRLLAQLARDRGKRKEPWLFEKWGGMPSVSLLRLCDTRLPRATKERYRVFLEARIAGLRLPSERQERGSPSKADEVYASVTAWLIARTRDARRFRLLFIENKSYGFRRNLWGLKPIGIAIDSLMLGVLVALGLFRIKSGLVASLGELSISLWICGVVTVVHLVVLAKIVTPGWVRLVADAYAYRLLEFCDVGDELPSGATVGKSDG